MNIENLSEFEGLHIHHDKDLGLFAIIALHNTHRGPAIGGCRCVPYDSVADAINDAMRLARAMSLKAAISDLPNGGGKAVIMCPKVIKDREKFFEAFGDFVDSLKGRYYTAVDSGTTLTDLSHIARKTKYISALTKHTAAPQDKASYLTAVSVFHCMRAAVEIVFEKNLLAGLTIAVQGVGKVGAFLVDELVATGANIIITDIRQANIESITARHANITVVEPSDIATVKCDILAPCALGLVINRSNIDDIKAKIICGSANNQLADLEMAEILMQRNITYVPDFVANAGGVILASMKLNGFDQQAWCDKAKSMANVTREILQIAREEQRNTHVVACELAGLRIKQKMR